MLHLPIVGYLIINKYWVIGIIGFIEILQILIFLYIYLIHSWFWSKRLCNKNSTMLGLGLQGTIEPLRNFIHFICLSMPIKLTGCCMLWELACLCCSYSIHSSISHLVTFWWSSCWGTGSLGWATSFLKKTNQPHSNTLYGVWWVILECWNKQYLVRRRIQKK